MKLSKYEHNWPQTLSAWQQGKVDALISASQALPFFTWPMKSPHAHEPENKNAAKLAKLRGLQSVMNVWFVQELRPARFRPEARVRRGDSQRFDFMAEANSEQSLAVEVEFGNGASLDRNLMKLTDAWHSGAIGLGVFICPTARLSGICTGGGTTFEQVAKRLEKLNSKTVPCPILVIGIDHADTLEVNLSKSQLESAELLSGNRDKTVIHHVVEMYRSGVPVEELGMPGVVRQRELVANCKIQEFDINQGVMFAE